MKITLSKQGRHEKQHIVLVCSHQEAYNVHGIIQRQILGVREPVMERKNGQVKYRFNLKYLDKLLLTFPYAQHSAGLEGRLTRQSQKIYDQLHSVIPEIDVPGLEGELFDYQKVGVDMGLKKLKQEGSFMLNDDMGLGKTIQALSMAATLKSWPCLVIAPSSAKFNWEEKINTFFPKLVVSVVNGNAAQRVEQINANAHITVINYEAVRIHPELADIEWEMVIADEFHRIKNPQAKQTKAFHKIPAKYKVLMSGTPMLNGRPEELWSPLKYGFPDKVLPYYPFEKRYCIKGQFGVAGYQNLEELRDFLQGRSLRRRKEQVLPDLPPVLYSQRFVELIPEQRRQYNEANENLLLWLEDGSAKQIKNAMVKIGRLKQICLSPELYGGTGHSTKIQELKVIVKELTEAGHKAIIFSQWSTATRIIERELQEYNPAYVDGGVSTQERRVQQNRFQKDEDCQIYIGTIGANKEAIDLFAASYVIFMDKDWVPSNNEQAIARAHRIGQQNPVNVIEIVAKNTIEEYIEKILETKKSMNRAMVEADRTGAKENKITIDDIKGLLEQSGKPKKGKVAA